MKYFFFQKFGLWAMPSRILGKFFHQGCQNCPYCVQRNFAEERDFSRKIFLDFLMIFFLFWAEKAHMFGQKNYNLSKFRFLCPVGHFNCIYFDWRFEFYFCFLMGVNCFQITWKRFSTVLSKLHSGGCFGGKTSFNFSNFKRFMNLEREFLDILN